MNTTLRLALVLVAATGGTVTPLAAADSCGDLPLIHLTSVVDADHTLLLKDGDSEHQVRAILGRPDTILAGDVWVYRPTAGRPLGSVRYAHANPACDTTLVAFLPGGPHASRQVAEIVRVSASSVAALADALHRDPRYLAKRVDAARPDRSAPAAERTDPFLVHLTSVVTVDGKLLFKDGDAEQQVQQAVGQPNEILPGEVWAYRRFSGHKLQEVRTGAGNHGCEVTLVSFTSGPADSGRRVTAVVLARAADLEAIVVQLKLDPDYLAKRMLGWHENAL